MHRYFQCDRYSMSRYMDDVGHQASDRRSQIASCGSSGHHANDTPNQPLSCRFHMICPPGSPTSHLLRDSSIFPRTSMSGASTEASWVRVGVEAVDREVPELTFYVSPRADFMPHLESYSLL